MLQFRKLTNFHSFVNWKVKKCIEFFFNMGNQNLTLKIGKFYNHYFISLSIIELL